MEMSILQQIGESAGYLRDGGIAAALAALIFGAVSCFLGYRLMRFWIALGGFLLGFCAGYYITGIYSDNSLVALIVAVLAGIVTGMAANAAYLAGVFLLCAVIVLLLSSLILQPSSSLTFFLCVAFGVAGGALGVRFVKPMVILSTSFQGGILMATGIVILTRLENDAFHAAIGIAIALFGCIVQFLLSVHDADDGETEE